MRSTRRAILGMVATASVAGCLGMDGNGGTTPTDDGMGSPTDSPMGTPDGAATVSVRSHADLGEILVGPDGLTLYMFDQDTQGEGASACSGGCADNWPPLTVDSMPTAGEDVTAELATFERADGGTQVMANGWPLYYYAPDESPGDATGQGVGDIWWVLGPDGVPIRNDGTSTSTASSDQATSPTPTATATTTESGSGFY